VRQLKKSKKRYDDDDGRTIAGMNVDGMPWYAPGAEKSIPETQIGSGTQEKLRGLDRWAFIWGVTKALLLISAVFLVGYLLFIIFCVKVWFAG
jgi:ABC-type multidrug transport system permease subunit